MNTNMVVANSGERGKAPDVCFSHYTGYFMGYFSPRHWLPWAQLSEPPYYTHITASYTED